MIMNNFYLARDNSGALYLYYEKPIKTDYVWIVENGDCSLLKEELFPEVKWEDNSPTEVTLEIKIK